MIPITKGKKVFSLFLMFMSLGVIFLVLECLIAEFVFLGAGIVCIAATVVAFLADASLYLP